MNIASQSKFEKSELSHCSILTTHALSIMEKNMPDLDVQLDSISADAARHDRYPDGSIFIEGENSAERLWQLIIAKSLLAKGLCQPNGFSSLKPFPNTAYRLYYTYDYSESLGDFGFVIAFPGMWKSEPANYQLDNLLISVGFYKTPSNSVKHRFVTSLKDWFRSVSDQGLFGEGPIRPASDQLEFRGRLVQFRVDARQSGQNTLNWLLIHALNFGYSFIPITDFIFDHEAQVEKSLGEISKKFEKYSIS